MISVCFSRTNGLISKVIRFFTKSEVSHCFLKFNWLGKEWVLQADFGGVVIIPLKKFLADGNVIIHSIDLPDECPDDLAPILPDIGEGYDLTGLLGSIFPLIGRWFKMKWSNPWNNTKALFCSELIATWLQAIDVMPKDTPPSSITPQSLLVFMQSIAEE